MMLPRLAALVLILITGAFSAQRMGLMQDSVRQLTLESVPQIRRLGQLATAHRKIFNAIHGQGQRLTSEADALALATAAGVDGAKFSETFKSFGVNTKATKARQLSDAYKIDGVPALGIDGRFFTSAALAGGHDRAVSVADYLIDRSRKG